MIPYTPAERRLLVLAGIKDHHGIVGRECCIEREHVRRHFIVGEVVISQKKSERPVIDIYDTAGRCRASWCGLKGQQSSWSENVDDALYPAQVEFDRY